MTTFEECDYATVAPWRRDAAREHSAIDDLPSIRWFVVRREGEPVGCIGLLKASRTTVRVRGWYVLPRYRGRGYGAYLQYEAEQWARGQGYTRMEGTTRLWKVKARWGWTKVLDYSPEVGTKMELSL